MKENRPLKILFMGTPDFAAGALEKIIEAGHEVVAVVTQPDKAKGRSGKPVFSPVKEVALRFRIPVLQPEKLKAKESVQALCAYPADIYVVAAFGQLLPKAVLDIPPLGCVNIHASLLPKYRGASPIQHAILNGDRETGVTIMRMDEGMDTGDILLQKRLPLAEDETGESLFAKLSALGAEAITEALPLLERGELMPVPQDEAAATHVPMLKKEAGRLDFTKSAEELERQIRAFTPWPASYTTLFGKQVKLWKCAVAEDTRTYEAQARDTGKADDVPCGAITEVTRDSFTVRCGKGCLLVTELQSEGKKRMRVRDFLLGNKVEPGDVLGRD